MTKSRQSKSRMYYYFWGAMTLFVLLGQIYVGTEYRVMAFSAATDYGFRTCPKRLMNEQKQKYWDSLMGQTVKTTPENVEQSHQGLFVLQ